MESDDIKIAKWVAWVAIVMGLWSILSWARLLFSEEKITAHLDNMNRVGPVFTPLSLKINITGVMSLMLVGIAAGILVLKQKEIGRKLFISVLIALPLYNLIWVISNLVVGRGISVFMINLIVGAAICYYLIKYFTRPKIKEQFR